MIDKEVIALLTNDLSISAPEEMSELEVMFILQNRVKELLETDRDLLMSYLYRLDVPMHQIATVLRVTNVIPPEESLARLILNRQVARVKTKRKYKQFPIEGWEY